MKASTRVVLFSILCLSLTIAKELNSLVPVCDTKSRDLNECVKNSAMKLLPMLKKGIRSLDFPPFDPMKIPAMNVGQESGAVYLKLDLTDTIHTGLSDYIIKSVNMDMNKGLWTFKGVVPRYELTGKYTGSGRILVLPLGGKGLSNFTFTDLGLNIDVKAEKKKIDGKEVYYIQNAKTAFVFKPGKNNLHIDRKEGDLTLAEHTSKFLAEHADEVFSGLKTTLDDTYTELFTQLIRKLFIKTPADKIFKN